VPGNGTSWTKQKPNVLRALGEVTTRWSSPECFVRVHPSGIVTRARVSLEGDAVRTRTGRVSRPRTFVRQSKDRRAGRRRPRRVRCITSSPWAHSIVTVPSHELP
jgi:hypothetical protein